MRTPKSAILGLSAILALAVTGCGIRMIRTPEPAGKAMPSWYHGIDPAPDDQFYYFTGYHEGAMRFDQARDLAASNAKRAAAAFLGTEIIEKVETLMEQSGTDWGDVYAKQSGGWAGKPSEGPVPGQAKDWVRQNLKTLVNESIRMAAIKDFYIEKVLAYKRAWFIKSDPRVRYDAGVLIAFPKAEVERLRSLEALKVSDKQEVNDMARRAEALWSAGDKDEALAMIQKAHRMYPNDPAVGVRLGQYYEDLGRKDDAVHAYSSVAEQGGDSEWTKVAQAKVTALTNAQLSNYLELLKRHDIRGEDLVDVLTWGREGQYNRAREMSREKYNADMQNTAMLWTWMLMSVADRQKSNSQAALYDVQKSQQLAEEEMKKWKSSTEAEPAIAAMLGTMQQGIAEDESIRQLSKIQRKLPKDAAFSPEIGDMAAVTLGNRQDKASQDLAEWLNRKP